MNLKIAKRLRKLIPALNTDMVHYNTSEKYCIPEQVHKNSLWGLLPRNKETMKVDWKRFEKYKVYNPKFRGQGLKKEVRYIVGIPLRLEMCPKKVYKDLKKNYVEVAQGAN